MEINYFTSQSSFLPSEEIKILNKSELLELVDELATNKILGLDLETTGLSPIEDKVIMLIIGTIEQQLVIDTRGFDFSILQPLLENEEILFVGHNIKFDYNMLKQYDIILPNLYDTMVVERVLNNGKYTMVEMLRLKRYSLAGVYAHYFDIKMSKTERLDFPYWGSKAFTLEQVIYGAKDVKSPLEIYDIQAYWLKKYDLEVTASLENKEVLSIGDIEYNGFFVDSKKWLQEHLTYSARLKQTTIDLDKILIQADPKYETKAYQLSMFDVFERTRYTDVNWDSPVQVYKILSKVFSIKPEDKDGKPSSGTKALKLLDEKSPIVIKLIQFRKETKVISSFGKKFLEKHLHRDGRLRTQFNQIIDTGRMSSRNPNMQQIPGASVKIDIDGNIVKDKNGNPVISAPFREAFVAIKGKVLITADYSNQEGRIMADRAKDDDYIHFFNHGDGDAHSFVATKMFSAAFGKEFIVTNKNENKEYRQKGKTLNFMISFGGSAFTLSKDLKITVEEAQKLINSFYKGFPTLKTMFDTNKRSALKNGFIRTNTVTKRIRWIPEWEEYKQLCAKSYEDMSKEERSLKAKLKGRIERKGMNTPIQGTAGDMTKTALILCRRKLQELGIRPTLTASIKIVNVVHDEIVIEADTDKAEIAATILKISMEEAGNYFVKSIAMIADPAIGNHWAHD